MDITTLALVSLIMVAWGVGALVEKIATIKIGPSVAFWDVLFRVPVVVAFCLITIKSKVIFGADKNGILLAILGGLLTGVGLLAFFLLLNRKDASSAVPLSALYPALTAILAFIFLRESLTLTKGIGIVLAMVAVYLLGL